MLNDLFGETGGAIANFVLALIVVVILIFIVAWVIKKIGGGRFGATNSGQAELSIVDTLAIDPKRRLVLVRHGKVEHLLLIGGGSDEVVERSIIGGLPIAARVQASKPQPVAPEKTPEPPARPSSKFLDRLERTSAARKQKAKDKAREAALSGSTDDETESSNETTSTDTAVGAAAAGTVVAGSAYATMLAATNQTESGDETSTAEVAPEAETKTEARSDIKALPDESAATPVATLPPLPKTAATPEPDPAPIDLPPLPKASSTPAAPEPRPLPTNEREALEQSLDAALHDSLLAPEPAAPPAPVRTPEPAPTPEPPDLTLPPLAAPSFLEEAEKTVPPSPPQLDQAPKPSDEASAGDMDFNLFDDGELEREMEAALSGSTPPPSAPSPDLQAQSTAAIEAELAIDLNDAGTSAVDADVEAEPAKAEETAPPSKVEELPPVNEESTETSAEPSSGEAADETADADEKPADGLPPFKDIPIELSRPDPVAIQIPTRGPAANATSVTKADNGITGEGAETLPEGPTSPVNLPPAAEAAAPAEQPASDGQAKPASGKSADLDEEMRRLLGEIAGDPKTS